MRFLEKWKQYKLDLSLRNKTAHSALNLTEGLLGALVIALLIKTFVIQVSLIPSGSMIPTMEIGDRLFVNKYIYRFTTPKRGDIVVFRSVGETNSRDFVKRCVGLPGETVELKDGLVFIDGRYVDFPGVDVQRDYSDFGPYHVAANSYFMLGDNRGNSSDSRFWGVVPASHLEGKALFTFWPISRIQVLH